MKFAIEGPPTPHGPEGACLCKRKGTSRSLIVLSALWLASCGSPSTHGSDSLVPQSTVASPPQPQTSTVSSVAFEASTTLWSGTLPLPTTSPTTSPYIEAAQPLLGLWQLASVAVPLTVDTTNVDQGYIAFEIAFGRPVVSASHGLGGCGEFFGAVSLTNGTVRIVEQLPQASLSCKIKVPALVTLGTALTDDGATYVVTGDRLVLSLRDGSAFDLVRSTRP